MLDPMRPIQVSPPNSVTIPHAQFIHPIAIRRLHLGGPINLVYILPKEAMGLIHQPLPRIQFSLAADVQLLDVLDFGLLVQLGPLVVSVLCHFCWVNIIIDFKFGCKEVLGVWFDRAVEAHIWASRRV